jgi:hypothetical protein
MIQSSENGRIEGMFALSRVKEEGGRGRGCRMMNAK